MLAKRGFGRGTGWLALVAALVATGCTQPTGGRTSAPSSRGTASPSAPVPLAPAWRVAESVPLPPTSGLHAVAAVDATHAWAVGSEGYSPDQPDASGVPVVERWDGRTWQRDPLPDLRWTGSLTLVAADSPTDVWTVGSHSGASPDETVTRVLRYEGTAWREVPFPLGNQPSGNLVTGLAVAAGHAWLVGNRGSAVVIQEWDGVAWQARRPPAQCVSGGTSFGGMPNFCTFKSVVAFAANDVWACGNGSWSGFQGPALFHWDGATWQPVDLGVNQQQYYLSAVAGRSARDLWAVGNLFNSGTPFVVHGDGTSWKVVGGLRDGLLPTVTLDPAGAPWVASNTTAPDATLSVLGTSGTWVGTRAPRPPNVVGIQVDAITAVPGTGRMFAVGSVDLPTDPRRLQAVVLEYVPAGSRVPEV
jgi:hypothetical protein